MRLKAWILDEEMARARGRENSSHEFVSLEIYLYLHFKDLNCG